jgi:uncharacterized protein YggE
MPSSEPKSFWPQWNENRPFAVLLLILGGYAAVFLLVKTGEVLKNTDQIGKPVPYEHTIFVEGEGKAVGVPDVATVSMGVETKGDDVATAQMQNTTTSNALIDRVQALGIDEADIQTSNYSVYQNYVWNPDTQTSDPSGWIVSQQLTVKVRETSAIAGVLQAAGEAGATNISGPNFTVDDTSHLKDEARAKAMEDVAQRAKEIASSLGVRFEKVVGYSEWVDSGVMPYAPSSYRSDMAMMTDPAPNIMPGSNELTLHVSVIYKLVE